MTMVQHELTSIHNHLKRLDKSIELLEEDFGELDFFAKSNIGALHLNNTQKYSFVHSNARQAAENDGGKMMEQMNSSPWKRQPTMN